MKHFRDLEAIIAQLRALVAGGSVGPDQKKHVEAALDELRQLRRKPHLTQAVVYKCVRRVAESLLTAFFKN
jgi:hypothetical protein